MNAGLPRVQLAIAGYLSPIGFLRRSDRHQNLLGLSSIVLATKQWEAIHVLHSGKHVKGSRKGQPANSKLQRGALSIQSIEQWPVAFAS